MIGDVNGCLIYLSEGKRGLRHESHTFMLKFWFGVPRERPFQSLLRQENNKYPPSHPREQAVLGEGFPKPTHPSFTAGLPSTIFVSWSCTFNSQIFPRLCSFLRHGTCTRDSRWKDLAFWKSLESVCTNSLCIGCIAQTCMTVHLILLMV